MKTTLLLALTLRQREIERRQLPAITLREMHCKGCRLVDALGDGHWAAALISRLGADIALLWSWHDAKTEGVR